MGNTSGSRICRFHPVGRFQRTPPVLRNSSIRLYCYYFGRFLAWAEKERLDWITASSVDLRRFLDTPPEQGGRQSRHSTIRQRYLRLLERVYTRLGIEPNPATHAIYEMVMAGERGKDRMKSYLTDREAIAFMSALPIAQPFDEGRPDFTGWKNRRRAPVVRRCTRHADDDPGKRNTTPVALPGIRRPGVAGLAKRTASSRDTGYTIVSGHVQR